MCDQSDVKLVSRTNTNYRFIQTDEHKLKTGSVEKFRRPTGDSAWLYHPPPGVIISGGFLGWGRRCTHRARVKPMSKCVRGLKNFFFKFVILLIFDQKMTKNGQKIGQKGRFALLIVKIFKKK